MEKNFSADDADIILSRLRTSSQDLDRSSADPSKPEDPEDELDKVLEAQIARDTLERYSGSEVADYQPFLILTNFSRYIRHFAEKRKLKIHEGSMFQVAHSPEDRISFLDFKLGSPAAALVVDLCAHLPIKAALILGLCGGLRDYYQVGDYFVPVAAIRGEGTSDFYFPPEVPAMGNFLVQKVVTNVLEESDSRYFMGIAHTTNKRFWEFNKRFRLHLKATRPQAIEMECATLFMSSYYHRLPLGALLLISDLPLRSDGIKTKRSSELLFATHMSDHIEKGVKAMRQLDETLKKEGLGFFRGGRN